MTRQIEKRMINEYLWDVYKDKPQWKRVRLGQVPDRELAQLYKVGLVWADAIVFDDPSIIIIETKIRPTLGAVGQLEGYRDALKVTPEFSKYQFAPVKLQLVSTIEDRNIRAFAESKGIEFVVFTKPWIEEYWQEKLAKK